MLVLIALAMATAAPAYASGEGATGGVTVPRGTTGGLAVPGQTGGETAGAEVVPPDGGAPPVAPRERSTARLAAGPPAAEGAPARARAAQAGQPGAPPARELPDEGEVDVQVPIDEGTQDPGSPRPGPSVTGGLAPTGLAIAGFAVLGAGAAAAGLGLRRLARQPSG